MSYDVNAPQQRYNTDVNREHFRKYRPEPEKQNILSHWSMLKGHDSDIVLKTGSGIVNGSLAAVLASGHANIRHTKGPYSLVSIAAQCYKHGTPWIIAGATYGLTLSFVTQVREKECPVNHMVAGYAAGTMLGSWYKWPMLGVWSGGAMAVAAGLAKYWSDNGILDEMPLRRKRVFNMYRQNWLMDKPDAEGREDAKIDVSFRTYRP